MKVKPKTDQPLVKVETSSDLRRQAALRLAAQGYTQLETSKRLPGIPIETIRYWYKQQSFMDEANKLMMEMTTSPIEFFAPRLPAAFQALDKALEEGDLNAARDVWAYSFGKPKQTDLATNTPRITIVFKNSNKEQIIEAEYKERVEDL